MYNRQLSGHRQDRPFTGGIRELWRRSTNQRDHTRGINDASALLAMLPEAAHGMLASEPHTLNVDALGQVPDFLR